MGRGRGTGSAARGVPDGTHTPAGVHQAVVLVQEFAKKRVLREIREVPGVLKVEELLTYENRRNGRSIPKLLGGLAGAAVLLAVASGRSHSASRRAAA